MPDRIAPIACSRMPKCKVRPYQSAVNSFVEIDGGPNDLTLSMVVLLLPARSAEPPHNSGSFGPTADSTLPDAALVANALDPGSQCGMSASQPSGSSCAVNRSNSALRSGSRFAQASNSGNQRSCASSPRAEPFALPVFINFGGGKPMMVRSEMNDGLSVAAFALAMASSMPTAF